MVAHLRKRVKHTGTVRLRLRLTKHERRLLARALRHHHQFRLAIVLKYTPRR